MNEYPPTTHLLSIVVPCFNEEAVIEMTHARLGAVAEDLYWSRGIETELIYVDDGSTDRTREILKRLRADHAAIRVIALARNFGHQLAVSAGLDHAEGAAVVIIDADLQDPPELIGAMLDRWSEGYRVVYAQRRQRDGETRFKRGTAHFFYRLLNHFSVTEIPRDTGDFRLIDREVVLALRRMPERTRFLRGMISWVGFRQIAIPYDRAPRAAGESKYPLAKMLRFAADGILSFSILPLRLASWLGLVAAALSVLGIGYALVMRLFTDVWVSGWTLLFIAILFMGSVQLLVLGIFGEYLGRIYEQSKARPMFLIDEMQRVERTRRGDLGRVVAAPAVSAPDGGAGQDPAGTADPARPASRYWKA